MTDHRSPDHSDQNREQRLRSLFMEAIDLPQAERGAFVDDACGSDNDLRSELHALLAVHAETIQDPSEGLPTVESGRAADTTLARGEVIGHFRILEQIGEGGFGEVYLAEQTQPVRRRVALKVIKLGMDTRSVLARFEAERQALAMMDDPGIARVYEAGATPQGRPYFAMEYVKGESITRYCDREKLNTSQRLELFIKVCNAIQHAHQKGVIHRDIKPGNILVTTTDRDDPQPKVIDFGIAKATSQPLTEKTLYTQQGMLIGTPEYMSPEQADQTIEDIDTRSDVYSLGVLLYELLSGTVPFEPSELRRAGQAEIQRIIREEDPPRPSTRLTTIEGAKGTKIADARRTRISELQSTLRRELEWIPLKALRKARTERYSSAEALGADVRRYLTGEPLEAGPLSTTYRVRKLLRRNTGLVVSAGLITLALVVGIIASTLFALDAQHQRDQALQEFTRAEAVKDFVTKMLSSVDPKVAKSMDKTLMLRVLDEAEQGIEGRFTDQPMTEAELRTVIGKTYYHLGNADRAAPHLTAALKIQRKILGNDHPDTLASISAMATLLTSQSKYDEALSYNTEVLEGKRRVLGNVHPSTLHSMRKRAELLLRQGKDDEALTVYTQALRVSRGVLGNAHPGTLSSINDMGNLLYMQGKPTEALPYFTKALEGRRRTLGNEHSDTLESISRMGNWLYMEGRYDEALPYYTEALETSRRVMGNKHPWSLSAINDMGLLLTRQGKYDEALPYFTEAIEIARRALGNENYTTLYSINNMGELWYMQGKYDEALPYYTEALEGQRRLLGNEHRQTLNSLQSIGDLLYRQGKYDEALPYYTEALEGRRRALGNDHPLTLTSIDQMGLLLESQKKYDEALPYYTEALEGRRRILGNEHPRTLDTIGNMGILWYNQARPDEARPYFIEALEGRRRILGDEHPSTLAWVGNMGNLLYYMEGKDDEALPYYTEAYEGYRRTLGSEHPSTANAVKALSKLYRALDAANPDQGYAEKAEALRRTLPSAPTPTTTTD